MNRDEKLRHIPIWIKIYATVSWILFFFLFGYGMGKYGWEDMKPELWFEILFRVTALGPLLAFLIKNILITITLFNKKTNDHRTDTGTSH